MASDGTVLGERRSGEGMNSAAESGFKAIMETHLQDMEAPSDLPVIICGMAGSRQGWREARYLRLPAQLSGIFDSAVSVDDPHRDIRILPGLAQDEAARPDVMRGEETQLLGCFSSTDASGWACLPGTHSKWVCIKSGRVTRFSTFMTGELFNLFARKSILRHAVSGIDRCDPHSASFKQALFEAAENPASVSSLLFSVRAGQLLHGSSVSNGYERLSGLMIGWEIAGARAAFGTVEPLHLIASGHLFEIYRAALQHLNIHATGADADGAVLKGLIAGAQRFWSADDRRRHYGQAKV